MSDRDLKHARLSPSGAEGWMNCMEWESDPASNEYARLGSLHHIVAANCLTDFLEPSDYVGMDYEIDGETMSVSIDHVPAIELYIQHVDALRNSAPYSHYQVEATVPIGHITGETDEDGHLATGTADVWIYFDDDGTLHVIDAKFGKGRRVYATENKQLRLYALGVIALLAREGITPTRVVLTISQPYLSETPDSWETTPEKLEGFRRSAEAAAKAHGDGTYLPTELGCKYCVKKPTCSALRATVREQLPMEFEDLTMTRGEFQVEHVARIATFDSAALGRALTAVPLIEMFCEAIEAEAYKRLLADQVVPGHKLVQGKNGRRQWADDNAAEAALKALRLKKEVMYNLDLITPAQAEKLFKKQKPKWWAKLTGLITSKTPAPTLARDDDPRSSIGRQQLIGTFEDLTGADLA